MINEEMDFTNAQQLREKAEKQLKEMQKVEDGRQKDLDTYKLLHELQVHQIELEMQNEELREAYDSAEKALKKYTILFDLSPMSYFSLDSEGVISDLNFTGADLLGEKRFTLANSNFKLFISKESRPDFNNFIKKVYESNSIESCVVMLRNNKCATCQVYMEGVVVDDEQQCLLSVVNISKFQLNAKI